MELSTATNSGILQVDIVMFSRHDGRGICGLIHVTFTDACDTDVLYHN